MIHRLIINSSTRTIKLLPPPCRIINRYYFRTTTLSINNGTNITTAPSSLSTTSSSLSFPAALRRSFTTSPPPPPSDISKINSYVHPLSQIVLERLQSTHADWLTNTGLDKGLTLNDDGTFVLRYPDNDDCRIWTSYEPKEKKHWLIVKKNGLVGQYLLQDNLKPAWHSSVLSTPEKVQAAVDRMIDKLSNA